MEAEVKGNELREGTSAGMPKATRLEEKEQFSEPIGIISFLKFLNNKTMLYIVL